MALVDMAYTKAERKQEAAEINDFTPPEYPWGLQIRLENDELSKLGVKELPSIGDEFPFDVVARVTSVSENVYSDGRHERCVSLQICQMGSDEDDGAKKGAKAPAASKPGKASTVLGKY